jgi:hypothetical protein
LAGGIHVNWPVEHIPDVDNLFRRIHANLVLGAFNKDYIPPGAFHDKNGISTDWDKYYTAVEAQQRAGEPAKNGIIQVNAGYVRTIKDLSVEHSPEPGNRAHANINGLTTLKKEDQTDARKRLARNAAWIIKIAP